MADATHDYSKHKKTYMKVGIALGICTGLTLALGLSASLDFGPPGPTASDFVIGLCVASIKASLVALIFMHLNHEKGLVYKLLLFTFLFFIGLMTLTLFSDFDPIREQFETFKTTSGMLTEKP
ncbi:MAG: cytochrome C oxidase subunit IV family protein [Verrucomicrobiales bacterium]|jgi:caa(3)-type oxidase subunit IV|nr:cytochrome C oxidase subunit IV family protein [Verrucomicrobiales bacterium]HQZ26542.1 cytochrome C oxidase subunit IV family protein [Verrucomicrobiales bacterium]